MSHRTSVHSNSPAAAPDGEEPPAHSATFHLDDGRYLVLTVAKGPTTRPVSRLELFGPDHVLRRRANLAPMLREDPS